ncbi:hypothetical protein GTA62_08345 [Roseobacter sp. HKCCD9010]|uniref:Mth938-like domain-containing protein n=1 Tax=unclassified Roseobacter TaxID=196798 RepID=UPI0014921E8A|nr:MULTISPECIES: Mth938-like domain-containing protein [unclassified Roseobacter]MBF9051287.1 hypothetical protein [Rhodobacterales bacterium HKCCD4356]NNV13334.1 hypothetical protein [Roseobacter sp. HKCCD7357]NNV17585.1 hypothetical protein [Roseobacter sp. HKCCD8768]NNV27191.1 hypothetical protein [Roseobacter sp. HKCCD8192]NNV31311.1 hypothetical protein [Roseobacter sp. HKCCD9061]
MQLHEVQYDDRKPIDGYGPGFFRVGGERIEGGAVLLPSGVAPWAGYEAAGPLIAAADEIDVLLIGTGAEIAHIPDGLRAELEAAGIGVEVMASPSACRTYNVLLAEGRRIGAALLPISEAK